MGGGEALPASGTTTRDNERRVVTVDDTTRMTDDEVLAEVRAECARWEARDELEAGFARLFSIRDEALRRGIPLPMSCPLETPPSPDDEREPAGQAR
jgi:hypothetical protein